MNALCDQVGAFADGELTPAEAETFRAHLADCAQCQADLRELMMMKAVEETHLRAPARAAAPAPVVSLAWYRNRKTWIAAASTLAAAAGLILLVRAGTQPPILLAEASTRSIEERVSYGPADRWRPYDVLRGAAAGEAVPHGVAAGYLLAANPPRAAEFLGRAGDDFDVRADRAVVALLEHRPAEALKLCDEVLEKWPRHPQALWNRALALRDLDRAKDAADAFDRVAALGESGWSDEAKKRAAALR
jgi:tetratricopeptide (TPR) repeat protein